MPRKKSLVSMLKEIYEKGIMSKTQKEDTLELIRASKAEHRKEVARMVETGFLPEDDILQDMGDLSEEGDGSDVTDKMVEEQIEYLYEDLIGDFKEYLKEMKKDQE